MTESWAKRTYGRPTAKELEHLERSIPFTGAQMRWIARKAPALGITIPAELRPEQECPTLLDITTVMRLGNDLLDLDLKGAADRETRRGIMALLRSVIAGFTLGDDMRKAEQAEKASHTH